MSESLYELKDGTWRGKVLINGPWKYIRGKRKRDVREKLDVLKAQYAQGVPVFTERQTLGDFLRWWLENEAARRVRPGTLRTYGESTNRMLPHIQHYQLSAFKRPHVQHLVSQLFAETRSDGIHRLSPAPIERAVDVLHNALESAVESGLIGQNPVKKIAIKVEQYEPRVLTIDEIEKVDSTLTEDRLEVLYRLALGLGLRIGELLGLRWSDVDLDSAILYVRQQLVMVKNRPTFGPPKTKRSRRQIYLPSSLVGMLQQRRVQQLREQVLAGSRWRGHEYNLIFSTTLGTPIQPSNVNRHFKKVLNRSSLPHAIRFHGLRHTFVTLLIEHGESVRTVQELVGHSDPHTTQRVYQAVRDEQKRRAVLLLDSLLDDKQKVG